MAVVAVAGLATMDFLFAVPAMPDRPEKYRADAVEIVGGGGGANAAVAIARLGGAPRFYTRLGDDAIGDMIFADLSGEGLEGWYLTDDLKIANSTFENVAGPVVRYYREGRDESTFGPRFVLYKSKLKNVGADGVEDPPLVEVHPDHHPLPSTSRDISVQHFLTSSSGTSPLTNSHTSSTSRLTMSAAYSSS